MVSARGRLTITNLGGQKGRGFRGGNFCPPSLSAAAEFHISLCEMHRRKYGEMVTKVSINSLSLAKNSLPS